MSGMWSFSTRYCKCTEEIQTKLDFTSYSNFQVIKEGNFITGDLGGKAKCSEFTDEIIRKIEAQ